MKSANSTAKNPQQTGSQWFVVHTHPRQEALALQQLQNQNFEVYLPLYTARIHRGGRWQQRTEPLFPSYLFIRLDLGRDNVAPIRSTRGVRKVLRFGDYFQPVPDALVDYVRRQEEAFNARGPATNLMQPGDRVEILDGPFKGLQAVFHLRRSADRAMVLLKILGGLKSVAIDLDQLIKVAS